MTFGFKTGAVPFGTPMPKTGIQKFKAKKGAQIIKILSVEANRIFKTHYLPGVGTFHCMGTEEDPIRECCIDTKAAGEAGSTSHKSYLPIAIYQPSLRGGVSVDFAYLPLGSKKYDALVNMHTNVGDVTKYDIQINCEEETYQNFTFSPILNQPSMIDSIPDIQSKIDLFLNDFKMNIEETIAPRKFTPETYAQAKMNALQKSVNGVGAQFTPNTNTSAMFSQSQQVALPTQQVATPQLITSQPVAPQPVAQPVIPQVNVQQTPQINPVPAVPVSQPETVVEQPVIEATVVQPATPVETTSITDGADGIDWDSMLKN